MQTRYPFKAFNYRMDMAVRVMSLNVQGLNSPCKRTKAFRQFESLKIDVLCLQETHFSISSFPKFFHSKYRQHYLSSYSEKTRGVYIGFRNHVNFNCYTQVCDPEGRYILVTGLLNDTEITIISYYAPNKHQIPFFNSLFEVIQQNKIGFLLLCGDSNLTIYPHLDKSNNTTPSPYSRMFRDMLSRHGMIDSWREMHPLHQDYTYFSSPHQLHSRIDHIFFHFSHLSTLMDSRIYPIPWSDHDAVLVTLSSLSQTRGRGNWRLDERALSDPQLCIEIEDALKDYLVHNDTNEMSPTIIWEAHKPVLRGQFIYLIRQRRKNKNIQIDKCEQVFLDCAEIFKQNPSPQNKKKMEQARGQLNLLLDDRAARCLRQTAHLFYTKRSKPDSMLARKLRQLDTPLSPIKLRQKQGSLTCNPTKILEIFQKHMKEIYSPDEESRTDQSMEDYLLPSMPTLLEEHRLELDKPITESEVKKAISSLKLGKAPGPDGYPAMYYKKFKDILAPMLAKMFNHFQIDGQLSLESLHASISMIPKPNTDHTNWSNYRPISLLNVDVKIMAKILASRLDPYMPYLIHPDQVGFMPYRQAGDSIRRTMLVTHYARTHQVPTVLLALDIKKAFDSVSWPYLFQVLRSRGLGSSFVQWISILYSRPTARIVYAGYRSEIISIKTGTRQGCPLSPFLFALAMEPLAQEIRDNVDVSGVEICGNEHKLSLFADDVLLYVTRPLISIPNLFLILKKFANVSGLTVNILKSSVLNITASAETILSLKSNFQFHWETQSLKYLGIFLVADYDLLYEANYPGMFSRLKACLYQWSKFHLTLMGRVAAIKMTLLPKLLYLFRVLPVNIPMRELRKLQSEINKFIWNYKSARLKSNMIQGSRKEGGLGVPNIIKYFQAARIAQLAAYHSVSHRPLWVQMEQLLINPTAVDNLLWLPVNYRPAGNNPVVDASLRIWDGVRVKFGLMSPTAPLLSFVGNLAFPACIFDETAFVNWRSVHMTRVGTILDNGRIPSFQELKEKYGWPQLEAFRYFQVEHFLRPYAKLFDSQCQISPFEIKCRDAPLSPGLITLVYKTLNQNKVAPSILQHSRWEQDLQTNFTPEQWKKMWSNLFEYAVNDSTEEINYKVAARWYLVPSRLHRMDVEHSPLCFRNCGVIGTYFHTWWECPKVKKFWSAVFRIASILCDRPLGPDPALALLLYNAKSIDNNCFQLLAVLFSVAKLEIAQSWKTELLSVGNVKNRMTWYLAMERRTAMRRDKLSRFRLVWAPWIRHFLPPKYDDVALFM